MPPACHCSLAPKTTPSPREGFPRPHRKDGKHRSTGPGGGQAAVYIQACRPHTCPHPTQCTMDTLRSDGHTLRAPSSPVTADWPWSIWWWPKTMKDTQRKTIGPQGLGATIGQGDSDTFLGQSTAPHGLRPKEGRPVDPPRQQAHRVGKHGATEPPQAASACPAPVARLLLRRGLPEGQSCICHLPHLPPLPPPIKPHPSLEHCPVLPRTANEKGPNCLGGGRGGGRQRSRQRKQHEQGSQHG